MIEPERSMEALGTLVAPWRWLTSPVFVGLDHVPEDRPVMFVANHTLMGMLDVPLLMSGLWEQKKICLHSLGDRLHFQLPGWRDIVQSFGVIEGTRENCRQAMEEGKSILVFPGGAREVTKRRGEKYQLIWGDRMGFARMAIECGYPIIPVASVGADDCWDILFDGDDLMNSPLKPLIERFNPRSDLLPPVLRGVGPTAIPRPERFYFHFGELIETDSERSREKAEDAMATRTLCDVTRWAIEDGIVQLLKKRELDSDRHLGSRIGRELRRILPMQR
jgi:1-acyl-sn-glycerol-3-phosphate acyltransferase